MGFKDIICKKFSSPAHGSRWCALKTNDQFLNLKKHKY